MLARIARQQALRGLAEALDAEARSQVLAEKSRLLLSAIAARPGETTGAALSGRAAFTASLAQLADNAGAAAQDAARQIQWQAETLARAETRAQRLTTREAEARAALTAAKAQREQAHSPATCAPALARKLQGTGGA